MYSNQNLAINGAPITDITVAPVRGEQMIKAQQGYLDASMMLTSFVELDPMRNMIMLQNAWDKQVMRKASFASSIYNKVVGSNAVLTVNGQDGGFKYKMAIETDNCFRTVEDTSDQAPDGQFVGVGGTTFRVVLNKKLAPFQTLSVDKAFSDMFLMVTDTPEPAYVGNGYEHFVTLLGSELDKNAAYPAELLRADVVYQVTSNSYITELSEKLGIPHLPDSTNYMEAEFKLGSGQGAEHWFTGKADSYKLNSGYTTANTQNYLSELASMGMDDTNLAIIKASGANGSIVSAADLMELLTIRSFNERFNSSLMFMKAAKISTAKGVIEFNEGLWQQMRRGKIFTYNKKGGFNEADLAQVRNYVYKYNDSRIDDTFLHIEAGTELADNIERIIEKHGLSQVSNLAPFLGAEALLPGKSPVSGTWDALVVNPVKIVKAKIPGAGMVSVARDSTLDYLDGKVDNRFRGINPGGKDHTTYSGYIYDVTNQMFSSNAKLPEGSRAIGGEMVAKHNVYLVRPERNPIVWGRNTGRYSSKKASDIASSSNLMGEGFFIYGFGAMWMPDPSKFVMIELKNRYSGIR